MYDVDVIQSVLLYANWSLSITVIIMAITSYARTRFLSKKVDTLTANMTVPVFTTLSDRIDKERDSISRFLTIQSYLSILLIVVALARLFDHIWLVK